jgi:integrase
MAKKPPKTRQEIALTKAVGLYLILQPSGHCSLATRFRDGDGKNVKLTLGPFDPTDRVAVKEPQIGAPLLLAEARRLCNELAHQRQAGHDIVRERKDAKERAERKAGDERDNAYPVLLRKYVDQHARPRVRRWRDGAAMLGLRYPSSGVGEPDTIKRGLAERWRDKSVGSITRHDIYDVIEETVSHGAPGAARRREAGKRCETLGRIMHSTLSGFFKWCLHHQKIDENPCQRVHRPPTAPSRERVLSPEELRRLWFAAGKIGYPYGPLAQLLVLIGLRRGEAAGLRWDEIDLDHTLTVKIDGEYQTVAMPLMTIPATRSKNKRAHVVPLSAMGGRSPQVIAPLHWAVRVLLLRRRQTRRGLRGDEAGARSGFGAEGLDSA